MPRNPTSDRLREAARQATGFGTEDEREALINTRAMSFAGIVWTLLLTGAIVVQLLRGESPSPYYQLMAAGGLTYAVALLVLRWRS